VVKNQVHKILVMDVTALEIKTKNTENNSILLETYWNKNC